MEVNLGTSLKVRTLMEGMEVKLLRSMYRIKKEKRRL